MFDMFDMFNEEKQGSPPPSPEPDYSPSSSGTLFVVSIGGSAIIKQKPDSSLIAKIANSVNNLKREGYKFALVVGGGKIARDYVTAAKTLGSNYYLMDELAITITQANAMLLINALEDAYPKVLTDVRKSREVIDSGKIPVFGGLLPVFTTDSVAALVSEYLNATFINLSNTEGVYTSDPKKFRDAELIKEMSHDRLLRIALKSDTGEPGKNLILDTVACMILSRSKIPAFVLCAEDTDNFENAVRGQEFEGTLIRGEASGFP